MELISAHIIVGGRVQGVNFRVFVHNKAEYLGIKGYVRNLPSGSQIEVLAEGDKISITDLIEFLKIGPPAAKVEKVDAVFGRYTGKYSFFSIEY
jgi:acylphosphatase